MQGDNAAEPWPVRRPDVVAALAETLHAGWRAAFPYDEAAVGPGRVVALRYCSSTSCQMH